MKKITLLLILILLSSLIITTNAYDEMEVEWDCYSALGVRKTVYAHTNPCLTESPILMCFPKDRNIGKPYRSLIKYYCECDVDPYKEVSSGPIYGDPWRKNIFALNRKNILECDCEVHQEYMDDWDYYLPLRVEWDCYDVDHIHHTVYSFENPESSPSYTACFPVCRNKGNAYNLISFDPYACICDIGKYKNPSNPTKELRVIWAHDGDNIKHCECRFAAYIDNYSPTRIHDTDKKQIRPDLTPTINTWYEGMKWKHFYTTYNPDEGKVEPKPDIYTEKEILDELELLPGFETIFVVMSLIVVTFWLKRKR